MSFIYLVEDSSSPTVPDCLAYAFEAAPTSCELLADGPGGKRGILLAADARSARYDRSSQTWQRIPKTHCWVGMSNSDTPTPADLLRKEFLRGHEVSLNGQSWMVPIARRFTDGKFSVSLPQHVVMNDDGEWVIGSVVEVYRGLWEIASWWWDSYLGAKLSEDGFAYINVDPQEQFNKATQVLATNYRVGAVELSMLGSWVVGSQSIVLDALCDVPTFNEWVANQSAEKKSGQA